jgi:hypothetical protein
MKLADPVSFASSIARFQIAPEALVNPLALTLPPLEMICGLSLLWTRWRRQAAFSLLFLSAVFLAALTAAAIRGISVECSCFGAGQAESLPVAIVRDVVLALLAATIYLRELKVDSARRPQNGGASAASIPTIRCRHSSESANSAHGVEFTESRVSPA